MPARILRARNQTHFRQGSRARAIYKGTARSSRYYRIGLCTVKLYLNHFDDVASVF